jgi:hypothetical protein
MTTRYRSVCNGCGKPIPKNVPVLGISPDEEGNKSGKWVFGCMNCAQVSGYEVTTQPGYFKREVI